MKTSSLTIRISAFIGLAMVSVSAFSASAEVTGNSLVDGLISTVVYGFVGIVMAIVGYKMADWLTPGDLHKQIAEDENRALATLAGSIIIGVCMIVAAVLIG